MTQPCRICVLFLFCVNVLHAQTFSFQPQNAWSDKPLLHEVSKEFATSGAVAILDDRTIEYKNEGKEMVLYNTCHRIYKINNDKGIEMFNKVYIPVHENGTVTLIKARTILPGGRVIDVPSDKIKDIEDEGRKYKIFAMEGVEKGAEVEYMYTGKRNPSFFGSEYFQSSSTPCERAFFTLSVPKFLKFDAKGFNGFQISTDSVIGEQRMIVGHDENIKDMDDEKYALKDKYLKRVEYKLSYNLSNSADTRLYTWKEFAKKAYGIYSYISPKEEKPLAAMLSDMQIPESKSEEERIIAIEQYIKSTINIDKNLIGDDADAIDKIVKRKSANDAGITRLFANLFEKSAIRYQMIFVSRRDETPIDESLENWNKLEEIAFYFPALKKYLSPTTVELRYPYIPYYWAGSKGLFLKSTTIGSFKSAIGIIGDVELLPYQNHAHNMEVKARFSDNMDTLLINSKQILYGYGAANYRPIYAFLAKDKQDEATLEIIKSVAKSNDITNIKVENSQLDNYAENKPLIISADIKTTDMTERAGDKILLKIGEIIGPQEQMYQEKPRVLPVEMPYPHTLIRKIIFEIPARYKVKNLDDINISIVHKEGNDVTMGFTSSYKLSGKTVTIDIDENYKSFSYPLNQFDDFRKVINASADFNKIVLVLEKEK